MKAFVATPHLGTVGGGAVAPLLLSRELAGLGLEVTAFAQTLINVEHETGSALRIIRPATDRGCRWDLPGRLLARRVVREVTRRRPEYVFVCGVTRLARHLLKSPVAHRLLIWEFTNATPGNRLVDREAVSLLGGCLAMLSPSLAIDRGIRETYGYRGRILRLPFWVEDPARPATRSGGASAADFIFLGRRDPEKGLDDLIEATAIVAKKHPEVRVLIAGPGDDAAYRDHAARLGCAAQVIFTYFPTTEETMEALRGSRSLILPSHHEGYPLVLLEAAALGVPFVATGVGSVAEIFGGTASGLIVPPKDPPRLAEAMLTILRESDQERRARAAAARGVFERVSSPAVVRAAVRGVLEAAREDRVA